MCSNVPQAHKSRPIIAERVCNAVIFGIDMADDARVIPLAMVCNVRMLLRLPLSIFFSPQSTSRSFLGTLWSKGFEKEEMWWKYAAVCLLACLVAPCQAYFRGDPVLCCTFSSPRTCISRVPYLDLHPNIFGRINKSHGQTQIFPRQ